MDNSIPRLARDDAAVPAPAQEAAAATLRPRSQQKLILGLCLALGAMALGALGWWFYPRSLTLYTLLYRGESYPVGTTVYLDDRPVGRVHAWEAHKGYTYLRLELDALNPRQAGTLRDGLVRVSGPRMVWLSSEFVDANGPPLVSGDTLPVITETERKTRRVTDKLWKWMLPGGGLGLAFLGWRWLRKG